MTDSPASDGESVPERPGYDALWAYFGLGRASFLVMPRVLLHEMPDEWQGKLAALMAEWDDTWDWDNCGFDGSRVNVVKDGKLAKMPSYLNNYRHPEWDAIKRLRRKP